MARPRRHVTYDGAALVGVDPRKYVGTLLRACDGHKGVAAQFSLNMLTRINRELEGIFDSTASVTQHAGTRRRTLSKCTCSASLTGAVSRRFQVPLSLAFAAGRGPERSAPTETACPADRVSQRGPQAVTA